MSVRQEHLNTCLNLYNRYKTVDQLKKKKGLKLSCSNLGYSLGRSSHLARRTDPTEEQTHRHTDTQTHTQSPTPRPPSLPPSLPPLLTT